MSNCCCSMSLCQAQSLAVDTGVTESALPRSAKWLKVNTKRIEAVKYAFQGGMEEYECPMDWAFIYVFPEWKWHCMRYYRERKEKLVHLATKVQLKQFDLTVLNWFRTAWLIYKEDVCGLPVTIHYSGR